MNRREYPLHFPALFRLTQNFATNVFTNDDGDRAEISRPLVSPPLGDELPIRDSDPSKRLTAVLLILSAIGIVLGGLIVLAMRMK